MLLRLVLVIFTPVVIAQRSRVNLLPGSSECGTLREDQLYNLQQTIDDNEFPWIARLYDVNLTLVCGSVLISNQHLLAPGHCFDDDPITSVELGHCKRRKKCTGLFDADVFLQHPKHITGGLKITHDIGLLRLKQPLALSEYIRPICLPSADVSNLNFVAQHHALTGEHVLGGMRGKFIALIVGLNRCQKVYKELGINDYILCASTCDNGSKYISGSILMGISVKFSIPDHYYLMGLLTLGSDACFDSTPDIFQRVDRHLDWIFDGIASLKSKVNEMVII